jgi:hypothetical protein
MSNETNKTATEETEEKETKSKLGESITLKVEVKDDSSEEKKKEEDRPGVCCGSCT